MQREKGYMVKNTKLSKRELRIKRTKLRGNKCHFRNEINKQLNKNNDDSN